MKRAERLWRQLLSISKNIRCGILRSKKTHKYFKFYIWAAFIEIRAHKWNGSIESEVVNGGKKNFELESVTQHII